MNYLDKVDVVLVNSAMLAQASRPSPSLPITSLQLQHYHGITHSFAQRQPSIPSIFNSFRTLSIATGVVPSPTPKGILSVVSVLRSQCPLCCAFSAFARLRHHIRHVPPLSPVDSLDCAYFPSPRGCPTTHQFSPYASFRIQSFRSASVASRQRHNRQPCGFPE
jgi:hypothetical protein